MSGRFVRKSSFRHVHGDAAKPEGCFLQADVMCSGDGNHIAGNMKYFAFAGRGGGGPVYVVNRDQPRRLERNLPKLEVHKGKVLDFAFNPFNDNVLATASEDCHLKITVIPDGGLKENVTTALADLVGHEKKVLAVEWHPTTSNVIATAGFDRTVKVWDVESQAIKYDFNSQFEDSLQHLSWNYDGSLIGTTCKDKVARIFDPRSDTVVSEKKIYAGSKKSSITFMDNHNLVATIGFTRSSMRQIQLFDPRNMSSACWEQDIDQSAGVIIPYYDPDTSILYVGGKGDSSIKYFEVVNTSPYLHFLSQYADTQSQKGLCFLPKIACDTTQCEIAQALRIKRDAIVPVHFKVPRKAADMFQSDLYPDTAAPIAAQEASDYYEGKNAAPVMTSMRPGQIKGQAAKEMVVKKSYAELEAELAAAYKRIAELEGK
jgi:hypothetical protein